MGEQEHTPADRNNEMLSALRKKLGRAGFVELLQRLEGGGSLDDEYMTHIPLEERSRGLKVVIDKNRRMHARHSRSQRGTRGRNRV